jgi:hypothetical protein
MAFVLGVSGKLQSAGGKLRDVVSERGVHGSLDCASGFE